MSADGSIIIDAELSDSKLKAGLGKLGNVASTALKGIGVAAAAAATAVVAIGTAAVKSYAEYEQLVGGVETLFKDSADVVKQYADNAFQTAGLSANQYMETVTSFSASLLQSLNGDTAAAAKVADMAITDMADNANKMGTSMESIQNAYQGFAKQNYTMLDNLKLGYGGTKEEMRRLLKDAKALSGVEYDISNLNDVYEAIHVIQTELGITGTTALEASETIQGSAAAMKASWSNLLVGLADDTQDFDKLLQNFISSVGTFAKNLVPRIGVALGGIAALIAALGPQIAAALPELVTGLLPQLAESAVAIVKALVQGIADNGATIAESAAQILTTLITGIIEMAPTLLKGAIVLIGELAMALGEQLPTLIPMAIEAVLTLVEGLIDNIDLLIDGAIALVVGLADGIIAALPILIEKAPEIVQKLVTAIIDNVPKLLVAAGEIIIKLASGIIENLPKLLESAGRIIGELVIGIGRFMYRIWKAAGDIVGKIWDKITDTDWLELGRNIVKGIWNGISGFLGWIKIKISGWVGDVLDFIKGLFGINSPSKVMADEIGKWLPPGIVVGMDKAMPAALRDIKATAGEITGQIQAALLGGQNGMRLSYATAAGGSEAVAAGNVYHYSQVVNTHDSLSPRELTEEHEAMKAREGWQLA